MTARPAMMARPMMAMIEPPCTRMGDVIVRHMICGNMIGQRLPRPLTAQDMKRAVHTMARMVWRRMMWRRMMWRRMMIDRL